jgi:hypothetical protein
MEFRIRGLNAADRLRFAPEFIKLQKEIVIGE